jgi:stage II sporulation protein D
MTVKNKGLGYGVWGMVTKPQTPFSKPYPRTPLIISALLLFIIFPSCVSLKNHYDRGTPVQINKNDLASKKTPVSDDKKGSLIQVDEEKRLNDLNLRVLIRKTKSAVSLSSPETIKIRNNDGFSSSNSISISLTGGKITANGLALDGSPEFYSKGFIEINNKKYRGTFIAGQKDGFLYMINRVSLDEYLYGVLPSEVSPSWPKEILKAQAVAARSFALYGRMNSKTDLYDLDSDVSSQVYKGLSVENANTNRAIDDTENEVLSKDGKIIQAFFHSNSGGKTASSEEVWGGKFDYLRPEDDPYCVSGQHYKWKLVISRDKLTALLAKNKLKTGELYDIKVLERTESGRVKTMKIYGSDGTAEIKGKDFRAYAGNDALKSTNFSVEFNGGEFTFNGLGWGHGVGLSQEGGKGMADEGRSYKDILNHFYNGAEIKKARLE